MDTLDDWLIAIHILAAVIWVGGALVVQLLATRFKGNAAPAELASFAKNVDFVAQRTFIPASLTLIATGIVLVSRDIFELQTWVVIGLIVWTLSFVSGAFFLGPQAGRFGKELDEQGPTPAVMKRLDTIMLVSRIEVVLLLLVVLDMSLKPGA